MAKSARASSRKTNNQRLKRNVFGPVEAARVERLSAKLLEVAAQSKPQQDTDMKTDGEVDSQDEPSKFDEDEVAKMDIDTGKASGRPTVGAGKRIQKRRTSRIVFPKYKDRKMKGKR